MCTSFRCSQFVHKCKHTVRTGTATALQLAVVCEVQAISALRLPGGRSLQPTVCDTNDAYRSQSLQVGAVCGHCLPTGTKE